MIEKPKGSQRREGVNYNRYTTETVVSDVALAHGEIIIKGIASSWIVNGQQVVKEKRGEALSYGGYPSTADFNSAAPYGSEHRSNHGLFDSPV